jgi:hypothetical protein
MAGVPMALPGPVPVVPAAPAPVAPIPAAPVPVIPAGAPVAPIPAAGPVAGGAPLTEMAGTGKGEPTGPPPPGAILPGEPIAPGPGG